MIRLIQYLLVLIVSSSSAQIVHSKKTFMLGSPFEMTVVATDTIQANQYINQAIEEVKRIEHLISDWIPTTQISKVNQNAGIVPVKVDQEVFELIKEYPQVIKAFPFLIAYRDTQVSMLTDVTEFLYKDYDFKSRQLSNEECKDLATFFIKSGLKDLVKDKKVKNLVDYVTGVEVGLDSNGRKNRGGTMMENIVETFVKKACDELGLQYMSQANAKKIKTQWGIEIKVDKSSRNLDFAINKNGKLYFIECNFYGGGGSKLKSTATEYVKMNEYWNAQNITFIWVTDGAGWRLEIKK